MRKNNDVEMTTIG